MAFTAQKLQSKYRLRQDDALMTRDQILGHLEAQGDFYEYEPAIVVYVIHDNDDPNIISKMANSYEWPLKSDRKTPHSDKDPDYSWVGRIQFRLAYSEQGVSKDQLNWALPLEQNMEEPLVNEIVQVVKIFSNYYYTKTVNVKNMPHHNADFRYEERYGITDTGTPYGPYGDTNSYTLSYVANGQISGEADKVGPLGAYFKANDIIRPLKHFEGDKIIESRFGSSIRMGGYGTTTVLNDAGEPVTVDKIDKGIGQYADPSGGPGYGNPHLILRNKQIYIDPKSKAGVFYYRILEDINADGSEIAMTSGRTISKWQTTCEKVLFQNSQIVFEEEKYYSPIGATSYVFPQAIYDEKYNDQKYLIGNQTIINSDRIIIQSKTNETLLFSKRRFGVVTDDELTMDCHQQMVLTSNTKTVLNAPYIFLGEYNQTKEPALLGQTTIDWLYSLCEVMKAHTHWYIHTHPDVPTGPPDPNTTQAPYDVFIQQLSELQQKLPLLCSQRVFLTGGGYAIGADGGYIANGPPPGNLNVAPGGYYVPNPGTYAGTIAQQSVKTTLLPIAETTTS